MRKYILSLLLILIPDCDSFAETINFSVYGGTKTFAEDTIISKNVSVKPKDLIIDESIDITNYGNLSASMLEICPRCNVSFENFGTVKFDNVSFVDGGHIFQLVSDINNMKAADIPASYTIIVSGNNNLSLADVVDFSSGDSSILLENTILNINKLPLNLSKTIKIGNNVQFIVDDIAELHNVVVLDNISGGANVRFVTNNDDVMFLSVGKIVDGKMYIEHIRETDYSVIFDNDLGLFLNSLRNDDKNNNLMYALDSAVDQESLNQIMSESVLFNPDVLYDSLQIINAVNMLGANSGLGNRLGGNVYGVMSDDFYIYGLDVSVETVIHNLDLSLNFSTGHIEYASVLDKFSGMLYNIGLGVNYHLENNMFARTGIGASLLDLDIGDVFYDNTLQEFKNSLMGYAFVDFGYMMNSDSWSVAPFVGVNNQFYNIVNNTYDDISMRIGVDTEYRYAISDLEYFYGLSIMADTLSAFSASGKIGFNSVQDMIGGYIAVSVLSMNDAISYQATINAQISF